MREIRTSGSTRGRRAADFNPLRVVLLYRPSILRMPSIYNHCSGQLSLTLESKGPLPPHSRD